MRTAIFAICIAAVFMNPALLSVTDLTHVRVLEFQAQVDQNAFEQYDFYRNREDQFDDLDQMTDEELDEFYNNLLDAARRETVLRRYRSSAPTPWRKARSCWVWAQKSARSSAGRFASAVTPSTCTGP
jgi:hypothetical protein